MYIEHNIRMLVVCVKLSHDSLLATSDYTTGEDLQKIRCQFVDKVHTIFVIYSTTHILIMYCTSVCKYEHVVNSMVWDFLGNWYLNPVPVLGYLTLIMPTHSCTLGVGIQLISVQLVT